MNNDFERDKNNLINCIWSYIPPFFRILIVGAVVLIALLLFIKNCIMPFFPHKDKSGSLTVASKDLADDIPKQSQNQKIAIEHETKGKDTKISDKISEGSLATDVLTLVVSAIGTNNDGGNAGAFDALNDMTIELPNGSNTKKFVVTQRDRAQSEHRIRLEYVKSLESEFKGRIHSEGEEIRIGELISLLRTGTWDERANAANMIAELDDSKLKDNVMINKDRVLDFLAERIENDMSLAVRVFSLRAFYKKCPRIDDSGGDYNFNIIEQSRIPKDAVISGTTQRINKSFLCE